MEGVELLQVCCGEVGRLHSVEYCGYEDCLVDSDFPFGADVCVCAQNLLSRSMPALALAGLALRSVCTLAVSVSKVLC